MKSATHTPQRSGALRAGASHVGTYARKRKVRSLYLQPPTGAGATCTPTVRMYTRTPVTANDDALWRPLGTDVAAADLGSNLTHELRFLTIAPELPESDATVVSSGGRPADTATHETGKWGSVDPEDRKDASAAAAAAAAQEAARVARRAAAQLASPGALALGLLQAYASQPLARQVRLWSTESCPSHISPGQCS